MQSTRTLDGEYETLEDAQRHANELVNGLVVRIKDAYLATTKENHEWVERIAKIFAKTYVQSSKS
jgi:hypothetical protein